MNTVFNDVEAIDQLKKDKATIMEVIARTELRIKKALIEDGCSDCLSISMHKVRRKYNIVPKHRV
jgi:hypothetical protein